MQSKNSTSPLVTVVMPALNESNNIRRALDNVISAFEKLNVSGEVIVFDDGSKDGTHNIVREMIGVYTFINCVRHESPSGIGACFWEGVEKARGEFITMLPGDGENDAYEILRYLPLMSHVDIVIPFVYNKQFRSFSRRVISVLYKSIISLSFRMLLNYMNGTVLYRLKILKTVTLVNTGFFYQTELLIKCIRMGYLYAEVPYAIFRREDGVSKALSWKSFLTVVKGFVRTFVAVNVFSIKDSRPLADTITRLRFNEITQN